MEILTEKLATLWPELVMLMGAVSCLITGLNHNPLARRLTGWVAALAIGIAALLVPITASADAHPLGFDGLVSYVKLMTLAVGVILLAVAAGVPDAVKQHRDSERAAQFDAGDALKGEFYCFFLLSLTGLMLTAGATDLVWLFLALELVSLPTYIMIATTRDSIQAQESAVKYFFLGAMSAAVFLYGFALIYGATGHTEFAAIHAAVAEHGVSPLMTVGMLLAILGLCFKVAAVPMHVYAADVYEGAATPVTAFLAYVPKAAGFVALMLVLGLAGWPLERPIVALLAVIAVLTMTLGNLLAVVQTNVKRMFAYSSIAQTGYLMLGLIAGPMATGVATLGEGDTAMTISQPNGNGLGAVLFYLLVYALATIPAFAVLGLLSVPDDDHHEDGERTDAQTFDALSGVGRSHPVLAGILLLSMLSLIGIPPLAGFLGKAYLGASVLQEHLMPLGAVLLVAMVANSAISAGYYLRIVAVAYYGDDFGRTRVVFAPFRSTAALIAATLTCAFGGFLGSSYLQNAHEASQPPTDVTPEAVVPAESRDATPVASIIE